MIKTIGEFEVKSELGRGGMGRVFRAHDPRVDRDVAIKVLTTEGDSDLLGRFRSEAGTTAKLRHQNIVTVHAYGEQDGMPYLVMELLEGRDLRHVIREQIPLTLLEKVRIMHQVAEGLSYAHQNRVIHRDIKPANIMLLPDGCVKIMDFGIARVTGRDSTRRTQKGSLVGTISYMAPEQFKLGMDADHMVDIFAFGDVFYELITGEHPFQADDPGTVIFRITSVEPKPVRELVPECPESLAYVIHQLLTKDRDLRYQSLRDVAFDIEPVLYQLRHERADQILLEAQPLIEMGQVGAALAKVKQALDVNPMSPEAQRLRNDLQRELHAQTVRAKVSALLTEAADLVAKRHFAQAIPLLENALRLDKSEANQEHLDAVRLAHEKVVRAGQLVAEARREVQKGNLEAARERASAAAQTDPANTEAVRLDQRIRSELEQVAREQALRKALEFAATREAEGAFDEALEILSQAAEKHGETAEFADARARVAGLKAEFEWNERNRFFQNRLSDAQALLNAGRFTQAGAAIDAILSDFADWPGVKESTGQLKEDLAGREREAEIARIAQEAGHLTDAEKFQEARAELDSALKRFPGDPLLREALDRLSGAIAARKRAEGIARALENIRQLRPNDLDKALQAAQAARAEYPDHAEFAELASEIGREVRKRQRRVLIEEALWKATGLLESDPSQAVEILRGTLANVGTDAQLESLLAKAEQAASERREQQAVDAILSKAQTLRWAQQRNKALQELERGISHYPHRSELTEAAQELRTELERIAKAERLLSLTQAIEAALSAKDWSKGLELVEVAGKDFAGERRLEQLEQDLTRGQRAHELANFAARVRQSLSHDDLDGAARLISAQTEVFGSEVEWQTLNEELEHRREYLKALDEARKLEEQLRFQEAEQLLRAATQNPARDKRAEDMLRPIAKKRARAEAETRDRERKEAEAREAARKEQERKEAEAREAARKERDRKEAEARELARKERERKEAEAREGARKERERKEAEARERARKEQERQEAEARERARKEQESEEARNRELALNKLSKDEIETKLYPAAGLHPKTQQSGQAAASATAIFVTPQPHSVQRVTEAPSQDATTAVIPVTDPGRKRVPVYLRPAVAGPAAAAILMLGYFVLRPPSVEQPRPPQKAPSDTSSAKTSKSKLPGSTAPSKDVNNFGPNKNDQNKVPAYPALSLPSSLQFEYKDGEPLPGSKTISFPRQEAAALRTSWQNPRDATWARADRGPQGLSVSVRPRGMSVGKHTAVLVVDLPGAPNTPQRLPVSLTVNSSIGRFSFASGQEHIRWKGELKTGEALTIQGANSSNGSLAAGELPASQIELDASGLPHDIKIESRPSPRNGFKLQLRNVGTDPVNDFTLFYRATR